MCFSRSVVYSMKVLSLDHDKFYHLDLSVIALKIVFPDSCFHILVPLLLTYLGPFMFLSMEFTTLQSDVFREFPDMLLVLFSGYYYIFFWFFLVKSTQTLPFVSGIFLYKIRSSGNAFCLLF